MVISNEYAPLEQHLQACIGEHGRPGEEMLTRNAAFARSEYRPASLGLRLEPSRPWVTRQR